LADHNDGRRRRGWALLLRLLLLLPRQVHPSLQRRAVLRREDRDLADPTGVVVARPCVGRRARVALEAKLDAALVDGARLPWEVDEEGERDWKEEEEQGEEARGGGGGAGVAALGRRRREGRRSCKGGPVGGGVDVVGVGGVGVGGAGAHVLFLARHCRPALGLGQSAVQLLLLWRRVLLLGRVVIDGRARGHRGKCRKGERTRAASLFFFRAATNEGLSFAKETRAEPELDWDSL
jgi:hypothetical protein